MMPGLLYKKKLQRTTLKSLAYVFVLLLFCEYFIYYFVLFKCNYPELKVGDENSEYRPLKVMFLADTHLLGSRNGHPWDKLRREWQMYRAFQTAQFYFKPELVIFLGDLFDEGKWCGPAEFEYYVNRFRDLFDVDEKRTEIKAVAGNHDIGFHYALTPNKDRRFNDAFETSGVEMFSLRGVDFVAVNSVAMEGDGCDICSRAEKELSEVATAFDCINDPKNDRCEKDYDFLGDPEADLFWGEREPFRSPVLIQHYPLYRKSDSDCQTEEPDSAPADEIGDPFREKWDCVSKESSKKLLKMLKPRLALSGHTHNGCRIRHKIPGSKDSDVEEWSVSSFSWRNRNNPAFLLGLFTPAEHELSKCLLPEENSVILIYILGGVTILINFVVTMKCRK